jgi:hypothetical protein
VNACVWEIGNNLTGILTGIGVSMAPILTAVGLFITSRVHRTVNTTAEAVDRTETKIDVAANLTSGPVPTIRPDDIRDQHLGD